MSLPLDICSHIGRYLPITDIDPAHDSNRTLRQIVQEIFNGPSTTLTDSPIKGETFVRKQRASDSGQAVCCLRTLTDPSGWGSPHVITPDGSKLVSSSRDGRTINVWDLTTDTPLLTLEGPGSCASLVLTSDELKLISSSWNGTVSVWDLRAATPSPRPLQGPGSKIRSFKLTSDESKLISSSWDGIINVWDLTTNTLTRTLQGPGSPIRSFKLTPDGSKLISAFTDGTIKVWDLITNTLTRTLQGPGSCIRSLMLTPDGSKLISVFVNETTLKMWNLTTNTPPHTLESPWIPILFVFTPDGSKLISACIRGTVNMWDLTTDTLPLTLQGRGSRIDSLVLTPDGSKLIFAFKDGTIKVRNLTTNTPPRMLRGHTNSISSLKLTPDGSKLISKSTDGTIKVWNLAALPEERITAAAQEGILIQENFATLPQFAKNRLFDLTTLIHQQKGKLPASTSPQYGQQAFLCEEGFLTEPEERQLALDLYNLHFFRSVVVDGFNALSQTREEFEKKHAQMIAESLEECRLFSQRLETLERARGARFQLLDARQSHQEKMPSTARKIACEILKLLRKEADSHPSASHDEEPNFENATTEERFQTFSCVKSLLRRSDSLPPECKEKVDPMLHLILEEQGILSPDADLERAEAISRVIILEHFKSFQGDKQFLNELIYQALYQIHEQLGKLPPNPPLNYGEIAYKEIATQKEITEAISCALTLEATLKRDEDYLGDKRQLEQYQTEAFKRFDRFSESLKNKAYAMLFNIHKEENKIPPHAPQNYGELAFHNQNGFTATDEQRARAFDRVYRALLSELRLEKLEMPN